MTDQPVWRRRVIVVPGMVDGGYVYYAKLLLRGADQRQRLTGEPISAEWDQEDRRVTLRRAEPQPVLAEVSFLHWTHVFAHLRSRSYAQRWWPILRTLGRLAARGILGKWGRLHWRFLLLPLAAAEITLAPVLLPVLGALLGVWLLPGLLGAGWAAAVGFLMGLGLFGLLLRTPFSAMAQHLADSLEMTCDQARGLMPGAVEGIASLADQVVAAMTDPAPVDEVVVCTHSYGSLLAPNAMAQALQRLDGLARPQRRLTLIEMGAVHGMIMPFEEAVDYRAAVQALTDRPDFAWVVYYSTMDSANFINRHPLTMHPEGRPGRWPVCLSTRVRDMMSPKAMKRLWTNLWRCHFHYLMEGDRVGPFSLMAQLTHAGPSLEADPRWGSGAERRVPVPATEPAP